MNNCTFGDITQHSSLYNRQGTFDFDNAEDDDPVKIE